MTATSQDLDAAPFKDGFRLRGEHISRLETFVDAAFAFAVTLLVISTGSMPGSIEELLDALKRIPTFGLCFALISMFWLAHNRWSRRYGLDDAHTAFLSLLLVFVTLIYVYPLRLVTAGALHFVSRGWLPSELAIRSPAELQTAFLIYGAGWTALCFITCLHFRRALVQRRALALDAVELLETRRDAGIFLLMGLVGVLSIALTFLVRDASSVWLQTLPGFAYGAISIIQPVYHTWFHRMRARVELPRP